MLGESEIKKAETKGTHFIHNYECKKGHKLSYTYKSNMIVNNMKCPQCLARGMHNVDLVLKNRIEVENQQCLIKQL